MPPMQKADVIIGGDIIEEMGHSTFSTFNRNRILVETVSSDNATNSINSNIYKLLDNNISSPLQDLLYNL